MDEEGKMGTDQLISGKKIIMCFFATFLIFEAFGLWGWRLLQMVVSIYLFSATLCRAIF
jgi:hypothetical protein